MRQTPWQLQTFNPTRDSNALKALQVARKRYENAAKHSKIAAEIWVKAQ
jgi:hypothetical protein